MKVVLECDQQNLLFVPGETFSHHLHPAPAAVRFHKDCELSVAPFTFQYCIGRRDQIAAFLGPALRFEVRRQFDAIALDAKNGYLYYHALTGHTLDRVKTSSLTHEHLSDKDLESKVEKIGNTQAPDRMLEAPDGSIYLKNLEHNAIVHWNPATKSIEQVIANKRFMWPDTLSWRPNDEIYVTTSQIENTR